MNRAKVLSGLLFAFVILCVSISPSRAQAKFGVAAGINWSDLGDVDFGSVSAAYESQTGWHVGAFADVNFLFLSLKPGIYYVNAGALLGDPEFANGSNIGDEFESFDYTYVSVPVDILLGLPLVAVTPYLFLGPEFKFNTTSDDAGPVADQLESTVVAGNLGIGVKLNLGSLTLYPELRYAFDISGIFGDEVTIAGQDFTVDSSKTGAVFARVGVGF